ncbi:uncharacterized protein LOC128679812 [Plodia interpunctella]|uniref:uncharacterized protein LOC128679812 n=1 Tax=Plodia interpunctella TaxID=58824 RepID=UPI002367D64E|nr:uncharacterized protein LOC128679812 [Plodia interpunctella]
MSLSSEELLSLLEEKANVIKKAQINMKKCPQQRRTKGYIEARLKSIEEDWQSFKSYHQALIKAVPKENRESIPYFSKEQYYLMEELYLCTIGDLKDTMMTFIQSKETHLSDQATVPQVKLPWIKLPTFAGQYEEWPTFNDLFTSLIHQNTALTKVQKLHYLKTSIAGEAEALLKHITVTENNYEQAWEILKQRYGNKRLIINSLLKRLFNLKKLTTPMAAQIKNLVDTTAECLNSLGNLQVSTESWDPIIIYMVTQKLDLETRKLWEDHIYKPDSERLPTWQELKNFLEAKFRTLELITSSLAPAIKESKPVKEKAFHVSAPAPAKTCVVCNEDHKLCHCKEFTSLSTEDRSKIAKEKNLCFNCLVPGHSARRCRLRVLCKECRRRHHTLLHQVPQQNPVIEESEPIEVKTIISSHMTKIKSTTLLATALIPVRDGGSRTITLRALIDQGSQASFISERATQLLRLKKTTARGTITGVGTTQAEVQHEVQFQLLSRYDDKFLLPVKAYVLPTRLTSKLPNKSFGYQSHAWPHLANLTLADPSFNQPGRIDLLLGVGVYAQILRNNFIKGPPGTPCAQETSLGWILFGQIRSYTSEEAMTVMHHQIDEDEILYKLWEIDSNDSKKLTKEEALCEKIYEETYQRNNDGRYVVKLPLKTEPPRTINGNTKEIARKRLQQMERRLEKNGEQRKAYNEVIEEYITLKHMEEVPEDEIEKPSVYLPHHAVIKDSSETTKVRIVFNASSQDSNAVTLNDDLMVGPQLQEDMRSLVMRFRMKKVAYIADVQKMYRQVLVTPEDAEYQRILWRSDVKSPVKAYRLLTVTFGTASAPYLAVRTLQQIAKDEGDAYPEAAKAIKSDFWMDDLMSGQDSVEKAIEVARDISNILRKGGFILQKWSSNSMDVLKEFNPKDISTKVTVDLHGGIVRALGLSWNLHEDKLKYNSNLPPQSERTTKRSILAEIHYIFDPLGWLAPALLPAKLLLQRLWLERVTWDEALSPEIQGKWLEIRHSLENLQRIEIKRWIHTTNENLPDVSVHGFCDASMKAYGAVAYLRVKTEEGQIQTELIAARTRVAPLKPLSLPRLELCGAVLLSKLLKHISEAMRIPIGRIYAWTDSTIVLSWLRGDPGRWQTFVRNRVVTILDNIGTKWFHVQSQDNPADLASRGMVLTELEENELWWEGPVWLKKEEIDMRQVEDGDVDLEKKKQINVNTKIIEQENEEKTILTQFEEFEDLTELIKSINYCKRFLRFKKYENESQSNIITPEELSTSLEDCVRIVQDKEFRNEINYLKQGKAIERRSKIKNLNPFLDDRNILRVGGRLRHADIPENRKHPMIMSRANPLAKLIVLDAHKRTLHGGIQLTMNYIRSRFWITRLKTLVSTTIQKCFICAKQRATIRGQMMGDLPKQRVSPARPFYNSGVDFAGPLQILRSKGRGSRCEKGYICIFICMSTKAVHLELVGDLTTDSFLGAFKRFVARRGRCGHIWSDRGTNFVGAGKRLQEMWNESKLEMPENLITLLADDGTKWHYNPPLSPNFGGLWEAGVKSIKHHLRRILNMNLTFEEMTTTLCQIEACLNSRPLCPIDDSDAENLDVLTPGHFLVGEAPMNVPDPDLKDVNWNRLSRWQHSQRLVQNFWRKWQTEYLSRLQQRPKWFKQNKEFQVGDIVVLKEENLPPCKWVLGRITDKHPGEDNICRVYSIRTGGKIIKRSVSKICELPINE